MCFFFGAISIKLLVPTLALISVSDSGGIILTNVFKVTLTLLRLEYIDFLYC